MPTPGEWVRLSPQVRRLTQANPSVFTGSGTNTFLIGDDPLWVLDPGPSSETHLLSLIEEIGAARVVGVLCTHSHPDHWPLAPRLAGRCQAPVLGFSAQDGFDPDRTVPDGELLDEGGPILEAIHTPGHARDHLCFLFAEEQILFSGDHVMGWSTSVIAPPGGNLNDYMSSLDKLERIPHSLMVPAHGHPIEDPRGRIEELRAHRLERTDQALDALRSGLSEVPRMVEHIYVGLDPKLHRAAQWSLVAHLLALVEEGRAVVLEESEDPLDSTYALPGS